MSYPTMTRPVIYDHLAATIRTGQALSHPSPRPDQSETPLFDWLSAEWTSRKPALVTASYGTPVSAPSGRS